MKEAAITMRLKGSAFVVRVEEPEIPEPKLSIRVKKTFQFQHSCLH